MADALRYPHELRHPTRAELHPSGDHEVKVSDRERAMAGELVEHMSGDWDPSKYKDQYRDDVVAMIERKARTGEAVTVQMPQREEGHVATGDLVSLLQKSLKAANTPPASKKKAG